MAREPRPGKRDSQSPAAQEHLRLNKTAQYKQVLGVDVAQEPNLARLARMNMHLHGDRGSSIYEADFLDKAVGDRWPCQAAQPTKAE